MTIEKAVTNLELSLKLQKLGIKQSSIFYWERDEKENDWSISYSGWDWDPNAIQCAAYTSSELGEILPKYFQTKKSWAEYPDKAPFYQVWCEELKFEGNPWIVSADTEADARGMMVVCLLANNISI